MVFINYNYLLSHIEIFGGINLMTHFREIILELLLLKLARFYGNMAQDIFLFFFKII